MEKFRKLILRIHGTLLIIGGAALAIVSMVGKTQGIGLFKFLQKMPLVEIGLYQAYLLIAVIGATLWIGSYQPNLRKWNIIGALAHVPPLTANFLFWGYFGELNLQSISIAGVIMHSIWIFLESFAAFYKK